VLAWATKRTVYLNTVIANWREFRQHEVTATEFIDGKEKDLQWINEEVKAGSDELTKEKVGQLEVRISLMFYVLFIYNMSCHVVSDIQTWGIITMKHNKTTEIVFLKNESRTMIIFVSDLFLKANHKTWSF
jgi:hypothetical protein